MNGIEKEHPERNELRIASEWVRRCPHCSAGDDQLEETPGRLWGEGDMIEEALTVAAMSEPLW